MHIHHFKQHFILLKQVTILPDNLFTGDNFNLDVDVYQGLGTFEHTHDLQ